MVFGKGVALPKPMKKQFNPLKRMINPPDAIVLASLNFPMKECVLLEAHGEWQEKENLKDDIKGIISPNVMRMMKVVCNVWTIQN